MQTYSVGVALFDFLPIIATATGLAILATGISARHRALAPVTWAAALLIPFGGLCKATWKLIIATGGSPIGWLENLLFISLAPGFVAMAFALFHTRQAWRDGIAPDAAVYPPGRLLAWLALPVGGALLAWGGAPESRIWFFWLLAITTVASITLIVHAILAVRWSKAGSLAVGCLVLSLAATITMGGIARLPQSEATAWLQEGVNLTAQLALAIGLWLLTRRMKTGVRT